MTEIKPCPFCGSTDCEAMNDDWGYSAVSCGNCQAEGPHVPVEYHDEDIDEWWAGSPKYDNAITAWNDRR